MSETGFSLRVVSPLQIFLGSAAAYGLLWATSPLDFSFEGGVLGGFLLLGYSLMFCIGCVAGFRRMSAAPTTIVLDARRLRRFTTCVAVLGASGLAIRVFERVVLRAGGAVSADFALNRDMISTGGSGPLAFVGALLGPMLMLLPLFVFMLRARGGGRKVDALYLALSVMYPLFDLLFQGSRSTIGIFLGLLWLAAYTTRTYRAKPVAIAIGLIAIVLVVWVSGLVFWVRTSQMGIDPLQSMYTSGYSAFAPPSDAVLSILRSQGIAGAGGLLYAYVHFCQYLLHGVYEFFYIAANVSSPSTYGLQSFYIPSKVVMSMIGAEAPELLLQSEVLRSGIYTTLFGPIIYDFGAWGGLMACGVFGFGAGASARAVRRGRIEWLPLHTVVAGMLPFAFVVNWYTSGTGQFMLLGATLLVVLMRTKRFGVYSVVGAGQQPRGCKKW